MKDQLAVAQMPIRLMVAGDDALVVACLEELLRREKDFEVIARWGKEETILFGLRAFQPDVLVFDPAPASIDGSLALLRRMRDMELATRTIFLCAPLPADRFQEAISLGAGGILPKDAAPDVLVDCIRSVNAGNVWLGGRPAAPSSTTAQDNDVTLTNQLRALTPREIEVVRLVCVGLRNKQIAARLDVAEGTVKTHLHRIYEKLTVSGRLELSLYGRNKAF